MKKILILVLIGIVFSYSLKAQLNCNSVNLNGDTLRCDIFTPVGNPVVTYSMQEEDTFWREWDDDYWSSAYPNAEMIIVYDGVSSTRTFNCHGYAWLRVEHGKYFGQRQMIILPLRPSNRDGLFLSGDNVHCSGIIGMINLMEQQI